jgi:hypothetical protein
MALDEKPGAGGLTGPETDSCIRQIAGYGLCEPGAMVREMLVASTR